MEFRLLGPLEAVDTSGVVPMGRTRARALLALLLLRSGRMVPAGVLTADLWGDRPPGNPTATLHSHVAALRRYLGPAGSVLRTVPGGYSLEVSPEVIDATRFEALAARAALAAAGDRLDEADRLYREALALWRGPALADLRDVAALDAAAVRLDEARLQAVEQHIDVRLRRGDADLVPELQALVSAEPLREALACQLMVALYRGGRQADALAVHDRLRTWLDDELGLRPGPAADRVQVAILQHDPALDPPAVFGGGTVGSGVERVVVGLPAVQDQMFGRDGDVLAVEVALAGARLVTLTGPGGVGKTRLSVAVAERWADRRGGLVAFVPLAGTVQNDDALAAAARALDIEPDPDQPVLDAMAEQLADRSVLAVLDNLEQIPQVGTAVSGLLERCPGVRVLATSRGPLRIPGERRHPLGPLALPAADASPDTVATTDAVALFVDRADGVDADDLADVAALCRLLEGLPLAIELVAARTTVLPPAVLLERLAAEGYVDPDLGEEESTARPARHRTLHATVAWSHDLLGSAGRRLFAMLGVFAGGASLEAVEALWAGVDKQGVDGLGSVGSLEVLAGLVDSGLVRRAPQHGRPRVQLPEPVRAFALAQLQASGSAAAVHAAHAAHFVAVAQAGKPAPGFTDTRRLAELDADADNLRAALRWLLSHDELVVAAQLATGLYRWWISTGRFTEGRRWVGVLLGRAALPPDLRAELLLADGFLAANQAVFDVALARYRDSAELWAGLDLPAGRARAAFGEAAVHLGRNRPHLARPRYEDAVRWAHVAGDAVMQLRGLEGLGASAEAAGDPDEAHRLYGQALVAARALGSANDVGHTAVALALTTASRGEHEAAEALALEAITAARSIRASALVADVLLQAGVVALERGDLETATARHQEALALSVEAGRPAHVSDALSGLAVGLAARGRHAVAVEVFATAAMVLDEVSEPPEQGLHRDCYDRGLAVARGALSPDAFDAAWAAGAAVRLADIGTDGPWMDDPDQMSQRRRSL